MKINLNKNKISFTIKMYIAICAILSINSVSYSQFGIDLPPLGSDMGIYIDGPTVLNGSAIIGAGSDKALRFWNGSDLFKMSMGNSAEFTFGPVTGYSIKTGMSGEAGRGWTWGISGQTPVAALDNLGKFQTAKSVTAGTAMIATWASDVDYAFFGHKDNNNSTAYALLQRNDGETRINAPAGKKVSLRNDNIEQAFISSNGLNIQTNFNLLSNSSIKFMGSDLSKIHFGNTSEFHFGPVTDFSIKTTSGGEAGKGWTWGVDGASPSAALSNTGELQLKYWLTAGNAVAGSVVPDNSASAYFGHSNESVKSGDLGGYALKQEFNGKTTINSKEEINFNINNATQMRLKNNGDFIVNKRMGIGENNIIEGTALTVDGRVYISDNDTGPERGFQNSFANDENYKDYLLWVEEGIVSYDFAISDITEWPDYVFNADYKLPTLAEVEKNIKEKGHLHTMPSGKTVEAQGFTVKEMTKNLVQTVEELTLHTIEKEKKINEQEEKIKFLKERIEALENAAAKKK